MADKNLSNNSSIKLSNSQLDDGNDHNKQFNSENPEQTAKMITIPENPRQPISYFWWQEQEQRSPEDHWKKLKLSNPKPRKPRSRQLFFWETLITVALLVMALWMQTSATRQSPEMTHESMPLLNMIDTQQGFD